MGSSCAHSPVASAARRQLGGSSAGAAESGFAFRPPPRPLGAAPAADGEFFVCETPASKRQGKAQGETGSGAKFWGDIFAGDQG